MIGRVYVTVLVALCSIQIYRAGTYQASSHGDSLLAWKVHHRGQFYTINIRSNFWRRSRTNPGSQIRDQTLKHTSTRHETPFIILNARTLFPISSETNSNSLNKTLDLDQILTKLEHQLEIVADEAGANLINSIRCLERVQPTLRDLEYLIIQGQRNCQRKQKCERELLEEVSKLEQKIVNDFQKCLILRISSKVLSQYESSRTSKIIELGNVMAELERQLEILAEETGANLKISIICLESVQKDLRDLEYIISRGSDFCNEQEECENKILEDVTNLRENIVNDYQKCLILLTSSKVFTKSSPNISKILDLEDILTVVEHQLEKVSEEVGANLSISVLCLEPIQPALKELDHLTKLCLDQKHCEYKILEEVSNLILNINNNYYKCLTSLTKFKSPSSSKMLSLEQVLAKIEQQLEIIVEKAGANLVTSVLCLEKGQPALRKLEYMVSEGLRQCNGHQECENKLMEKVSKLQEIIVTDFQKCVTK